MKIRRVITNGFRGLPDRAFELAPASTRAPADLVFLTGPGGAGKTSLLEAIIAAKEDIAPYGLSRSARSFVRQGETAAKVRVDWVLSPDERARSGATSVEISSESIFSDGIFSSAEHDPALVALLGVYDVDRAIGKVEYFHASRRIPRGGIPSIASVAGPSAERLVRLTRDDAKYAEVLQYVLEASLGLHDVEGVKGAQRLVDAFSSLCRTRRLAGLEREGRAIVPRFADTRGTSVGVEELSDSERQALLFAVTFLRSGVERSLVLIDTPELHIPEREVGAFVAAIQRLGVDNQLIMATGSQSAVTENPTAHVVSLG
jgi:hypothetical protein